MQKDHEVVYLQANENWRFLAQWRQLALAGQLAVLAGALSFTNFAADHSLSRVVQVGCFLLLALISVVLLIADRRTHRLTMDACRAGIAFEGDQSGFFRENDMQDKKEGVDHTVWYKDPHSLASVMLSAGSAIFFTVLATLILLGFFSSTAGGKEPWDYRILHGPLAVSPSSGATSLESQLNQASEDGWEVLATGRDATDEPFLILRRHKK
jgi:hypothetical protein